MFSSRGLFSSITCPELETCRLPNCIFSHAPRIPAKPLGQTEQNGSIAARDSENARSSKRRKLEDGTSSAPRALQHDLPRNHDLTIRDTQESAITTPRPRAKENDGSSIIAKYSVKLIGDGKKEIAPVKKAGQPSATLKTVTRSISPPATIASKKKSASDGQALLEPDTKESLNPRIIQNDPAGHTTRLLYLQKLREIVNRLNKEVAQSPDPAISSLHLTDGQLITALLNEEEEIARENGKLYGNIIKMRMLQYKKMKLEDWIQIRRQSLAVLRGEEKTKEPDRVETGLSSAEELLMLPRLIANQDGLSKHGYVTSLPTEAEVSSAKAGVVAAGNWETCDRCSSRFQVFPQRREDGALTTGGKCKHHPGKKHRPPKPPGTIGPSDMKWLCCHETVGSEGCETSASHVFKISGAARLDSLMPFIETPKTADGDTDGAKSDTAVTFDCEMGYTAYGLELIRLTATSWPDGKALIDVLVRPLGTVLDLNSRYSGVWPDAFANAKECDVEKDDPKSFLPDKDGKLNIVKDPAAARSLLLQHLTPLTPLMGHALENDLNSVRLIHPSIVDTVLLFPHPRGGLPYRQSLKYLVEKHLGRAIQTADVQGHDSLEDARATGELIRWKVKTEWKSLKLQGWTIRNGAFHPPEPKTKPPAEGHPEDRKRSADVLSYDGPMD